MLKGLFSSSNHLGAARSPAIAASATLVLNTAECIPLALFAIFCSVSKPATTYRLVPLIDLFKFPARLLSVSISAWAFINALSRFSRTSISIDPNSFASAYPWLVSNSESFPSNQFSWAEIFTLFRTNQYAMFKR